MTSERLQKYIAAAGLCSRRKAEELIRAGRVSVNGRVARELGIQIEPGTDTVEVDGQVVEEPASPVLYLFHKPRGVVSTLSDPQKRRCLSDYIVRIPERVFPIGRLDYDVNGLLLLTNDGAIAEQLSHPRYGKERKYWAVLRGQIERESLLRLKKGVYLEDGRAAAKDVRLLRPTKRTTELLGRLPEKASLVEVIVAEGRNHFVKRLFAAAGHPVKKLCRVGFGPYELGGIEPGEYKLGSLRKLKEGAGQMKTKTERKRRTET